MTKINLIVEKGEDGRLWGRVNFRNNLIVDVATTVDALERKMRKLIMELYDIDIEFTNAYDVSAFFENFSYLNQSRIAYLSGINPGLLRQYASGVKHPSAQQAKKIEVAIHKLAKELKSVSLYA